MASSSMRIATSSAPIHRVSLSAFPRVSARRAPRPCRFREEEKHAQRKEQREREGQSEQPQMNFQQEEKTSSVESGLVFRPEQEALPQMQHLDELLTRWQEGADVSFARTNFAEKAEASLNEQINVEMVNSHVYLQMSSYFSRDGVSLLGFASYFRRESEDERSDAERLMEYQSRRGGRTKIGAIATPPSEFNHPQKGGVLNACEMALSLERVNFEKLRKLHDVAEQCNDADMTNFVEEMLDKNSKEIRRATVLVTEVQRAGTGHGIVHIDKMLLEEYGRAELGPHPFSAKY